MERNAAERHYPVPPGSSGGVPLTSPQLLTPREAARTLAVSERTLWSLTRRGDVRAVRFGRAVRYDVADLHTLVLRAKGQAGGQ
jgi:excisionase family DNA binding protein